MDGTELITIGFDSVLSSFEKSMLPGKCMLNTIDKKSNRPNFFDQIAQLLVQY